MPEYFFNIENGHPSQDEVGDVLKDDRAAWQEAMRRAREIEDVLRPGGAWQLEVRTRDGPLFRVRITTEWVR